jgi:hypothetical protein
MIRQGDVGRVPLADGSER